MAGAPAAAAATTAPVTDATVRIRDLGPVKSGCDCLDVMSISAVVVGLGTVTLIGLKLAGVFDFSLVLASKVGAQAPNIFLMSSVTYVTLITTASTISRDNLSSVHRQEIKPVAADASAPAPAADRVDGAARRMLPRPVQVVRHEHYHYPMTTAPMMSIHGHGPAPLTPTAAAAATETKRPAENKAEVQTNTGVEASAEDTADADNDTGEADAPDTTNAQAEANAGAGAGAAGNGNVQPPPAPAAGANSDAPAGAGAAGNNGGAAPPAGNGNAGAPPV